MVVGNWKMNKTPKEAAIWINEVKQEIKEEKNCKVVVCVPFLDIQTAVEAAINTKINIGAQNCHFERKGAYTGEISAAMLRESGVRYVILGHSERRTHFSETDELINRKIKSAVEANIKAIFCVGETEKERKDGQEKEKIQLQIKTGLKDINKEEIKNIIIAYEPVWAIGTSKVATNEEISQICEWIREVLIDIYDEVVAKEMYILYGGSINTENISKLLNISNIDGYLIGGASLSAEEFKKLINVLK